MAGQVGQHEVVLIATDSSGSSALATIRYDLGGKYSMYTWIVVYLIMSQY